MIQEITMFLIGSQNHTTIKGYPAILSLPRSDTEQNVLRQIGCSERLECLYQEIDRSPLVQISLKRSPGELKEQSGVATYDIGG